MFVLLAAAPKVCEVCLDARVHGRPLQPLLDPGGVAAGDAFLNLAGDWSRSDNLTNELRTLNPNLTQTPGILSSFDTSGSFGGPIMKDHLWFYGSYRSLDTQTAMEGINANANAGNASRWDWVGAPIDARLVQDRQMIIGRVTGQKKLLRIEPFAAVVRRRTVLAVSA